MSEFFILVLTVLAVAIIIQIWGLKRDISRLPKIEDDLLDIKRDLRKLAPQEIKASPAQPASPPPTPAPFTTSVHVASPSQPPTPSTPPMPVRVPVYTPPLSTTPPSAISRPPATPSKLAQTVGEVLNRIWQWILVGEEFRPKGVTMEYAVATTWLARIGVIVLVTCVGYFLKWSIDRDLLGPTARVAMSITFGVGLLGWGFRMLGRRWDILGQGFVGGGLAILYFSMYAMGPLYHLLDSTLLVFALMILVTVTSGILALYANSMLVAIFGIIGGFTTPILLSTGQANFMGLFSYLLLLNLGILAISAARQWRLLNYLSFVFTYVLYAMSLRQYQTTDFPIVLTFLSLFFIIHSTLVFHYNLRRGLPATVLEIIHLVLNASIFSVAAYALIIEAHGRPYPALMTLGLAVYYILHVALFLHRRLGDRTLLITLISLAGFFTTMTMPLALEKETLTIAWALQAYMFLRLGYSMRSNFLRHLGYALYGLTFMRLIGYELPRFETFNLATTTPMSAYWKTMSSRVWTFGTVIASIFAAFRLEKNAPIPAASTPPPPDIPAAIPDTVARPAFFWSMVVFLFIYLHCELAAMFSYYAPWRPAVLTALWGGMAAFFLLRYLTAASAVSLAALVFFAAGAIGKTLFIDIPVWDLCQHCYFDQEYSGFMAFTRWLDFGCVLALLLSAATFLYRRPVARALPGLFGYTALALLWLYLTLELNTLLHWKLPLFQAGGISVLWTVFAFSFVAGGIWKAVAPLRYTGLALFTLVVGKVFLSDLAGMPVIYRILALMILGILLLLGAFAYLRASKRFTKETP